MNLTKIAAIYADSEQLGGQTVTIGGWARTIRDMKTFGFIELNDGSCFKNLQVVMSAEELDNYKEIAGQNVGAGKVDRVQKGTKQGLIMAVGLSAAVTAILLFLNKYLFGFFTDTPELITLAGRMMRIMAVGYVGVAVSQVLGGVMRGAGDTMTPMWISMITTIVLRIPVAYGMAYFTASAAWPNGHPFSLSTSLLISWTMGAVISFVAYRKGKWRKKAHLSMGKDA